MSQVQRAISARPSRAIGPHASAVPRIICAAEKRSYGDCTANLNREKIKGYKMDTKVPSELIVLADAFNKAITSSNRAWLAAATLTAVSIGATAGSENGTWPGITLTGFNFFAAITLSLAAINLRLCSVHSNMYETQWVLHRYLRDIKADTIAISDSVTLKELTHRLSVSAYNRFYPILFAYRDDVREKIMNIVKPIFEILYIGTPLIGMLVALIRCFAEPDSIGVLEKFLLAVATVFVFVQFFVSVSTMVHVAGARKRLADEHSLI